MPTPRRRVRRVWSPIWELGPSGTAKSTTRPLVTAGPIGRHGSSASRAESASKTAGVVRGPRFPGLERLTEGDATTAIARRQRETRCGILLGKETGIISFTSLLLPTDDVSSLASGSPWRCLPARCTLSTLSHAPESDSPRDWSAPVHLQHCRRAGGFDCLFFAVARHFTRVDPAFGDCAVRGCRSRSA